MDYSVGEVARHSGVTVRTLHLYDELGLVVPDRTPAGHRRYGRHHLELLQQVLFFRELGFELSAIGEIVTDPSFDRRSALLRQRDLVAGKLAQVRRMLDAIDLAVMAIDEGVTMELKDMFDGFDPAQYEDEAKERWGDTEAYRESHRRAGNYTKDDWATMGAEMEEISQRLAALKRDGVAPDAAEAVAAAEAHRLHIERWFYPCGPEMHTGLGDMYVDDPRFTAYWEKYEPDLAPFVRDAFAANAARRN
jgi:MerR family transcriptional regulator, thiopeptide resistance regulator